MSLSVALLPSRKTIAAGPAFVSHGLAQIYQWVASLWVIIIELKPVLGHHYSGPIVYVCKPVGLNSDVYFGPDRCCCE